MRKVYFHKFWLACLLFAAFSCQVLLISACQNQKEVPTNVARLSGKTMGTSYSIILPGFEAKENFQTLLDSLLVAINDEVSTYEANSLISQFNNGDTLLLPVVPVEVASDKLHSKRGEHLAANLFLMQAPVEHTDGYFDPTVGPLVEYYGFGSKPLDTSAIDLAEVERLRQLVGIYHLRYDTLPEAGMYKLYPSQAGVRLDLSAIAKGYAVDQVCYLIREMFQTENYFVEIGGETRAAGYSPRGDQWTVGINTPDPDASLSDMALLVSVTDAAIATSGNYRNVRVRGGKPIVHTVNPHSGLPRQSTLLSATVLAPNCALADAYATACMASGEDAVQVLAKAQLPGCLIFSTPSGNYEIRYVGEFTRYVQQMPAR